MDVEVAQQEVARLKNQLEEEQYKVNMAEQKMKEFDEGASKTLRLEKEKVGFLAHYTNFVKGANCVASFRFIARVTQLNALGLLLGRWMLSFRNLKTPPKRWTKRVKVFSLKSSRSVNIQQQEK